MCSNIHHIYCNVILENIVIGRVFCFPLKVCFFSSNFSLSFAPVDSSVRDGLYHEFKKHGDVTRIFVNGEGSTRYAIVHFRRYICFVPYIRLWTNGQSISIQQRLTLLKLTC